MPEDHAAPTGHERTPFMSLPEVAMRLEKSRSRIYALAASGDLPVATVGGRFVVLRQVFDEWVAAKTAGALGRVK